MSDLDFKRQLASARKMGASDNTIGGAKSLAKDYAKGMATGSPAMAQAKVAWKLSRQINWMLDWMIGIPLFLAILKDIVDFLGLAILPGINDVIVWCISAITTIIIFVLGAGKAKATTQLAKKISVIIVCTIIDEVPGIAFIPALSIMVIVSFLLVLIERVGYEEEEKKRKKLESQYEEEGEYAQAA